MSPEVWAIALRPDLAELFHKYRDYKKIAAHIYEIAEDQVTPQQRINVKIACLGIAYGVQTTPKHMIKFDKE